MRPFGLATVIFLWAVSHLAVGLGLSTAWAQGLPGDPFAQPEEVNKRTLPGDPFGQPEEVKTPSLPGDPLGQPGLSPVTPDKESFFSELVYGGYLESRNRFSLTGREPVSLSLTAFGEITAKKESWSFYGSLKGVFEGAARSWPGNHKAGWAEIYELYVTYDSPRVDFWLGRKIHRWGAADGYNPLDLFNPMDSRNPIAQASLINRVPQWMAGAAWSFGAISLEAIVLPTAGVVAMPEPGSPWEPKAYQELRRLRKAGFLSLDRQGPPNRWFRDGEYGLRLSSTLGGNDISLMAYRGFGDEPLFRLELGPTGLKAQGEYARYTAYGLAWARGMGAGTFRGEVVLKPDFPAQGPVAWAKTRLIQAVVGVDHDFAGLVYVNAQGFIESLQKTRSSTKETRYGLTYEARVKWAREALEVGGRGQVYTTGEGALNEAFLEWRLDDRWKLSIGGLWFSGSKEGSLGQYRENDCLYLNARFSF